MRTAVGGGWRICFLQCWRASNFETCGMLASNFVSQTRTCAQRSDPSVHTHLCKGHKAGISVSQAFILIYKLPCALWGSGVWLSQQVSDLLRVLTHLHSTQRKMLCAEQASLWMALEKLGHSDSRTSTADKLEAAIEVSCSCGHPGNKSGTAGALALLLLSCRRPLGFATQGRLGLY